MEKVSREYKLMATKDIVANYARAERNLSPDELCDVLRKVYHTIEEVVPEPEGRKIGLG